MSVPGKSHEDIRKNQQNNRINTICQHIFFPLFKNRRKSTNKMWQSEKTGADLRSKIWQNFVSAL